MDCEHLKRVKDGEESLRHTFSRHLSHSNFTDNNKMKSTNVCKTYFHYVFFSFSVKTTKNVDQTKAKKRKQDAPLTNNDPCKCKDSRENPVCGSDHVTYKNKCSLRKAACVKQANLTLISEKPCGKKNCHHIPELFLYELL